MKRKPVRSPAEVVADVTRGELVSLTMASRGVPRSDAQAAALAQSGLLDFAPHPYKPDPIDDWLRNGGRMPAEKPKRRRKAS